MATDDDNNTPILGAEDPILDAQRVVFEAKALLGCLATQLAEIHYENTEVEPDMLAACSGVMRLLHKVAMDLDPQQFRKAVLASETKEKAHANA
jgi:hypothetical protein